MSAIDLTTQTAEAQGRMILEACTGKHGPVAQALAGLFLEAKDKAARYDQLNTPELVEFMMAVEREALHQRVIHAAKGDAGKSDADWFWLVGYLAGKALHAGNGSAIVATHNGDTTEFDAKRLHHIITTAAACLNWHAARVGTYAEMRPGIAAPEGQA